MVGISLSRVEMPDLKRVLIYDPATDKDATVSPNGDLIVSLDGENIGLNGLVPEAHDYISLAQTATVDTWTYKSGGSGGTLVATVTVTFTDSGKGTISTVVRT